MTPLLQALPVFNNQAHGASGTEKGEEGIKVRSRKTGRAIS